MTEKNLNVAWESKSICLFPLKGEEGEVIPFSVGGVNTLCRDARRLRVAAGRPQGQRRCLIVWRFEAPSAGGRIRPRTGQTKNEIKVPPVVFRRLPNHWPSKLYCLIEVVCVFVRVRVCLCDGARVSKCVSLCVCERESLSAIPFCNSQSRTSLVSPSVARILWRGVRGRSWKRSR